MAGYTEVYIYGTHVLREAIARAPKAVKHVYLVRQTGGAETLVPILKAANIPFEYCAPGHLPGSLDPEVNHQGVVALVSQAGIMLPYKPFIESLAVTPDSALVVLGELQDPQNVGAVIRSAAAFGVAGVLVPEHRQVQLTGAVVKVSAGMVFTVPIVSIGNVNATLHDLKERGFWVYGLSGEGTTDIDKESWTAPAAFVIGNEGVGIREKTIETCDITLRIPIDERCESLNVAASAAVTLYAWSAGRRAQIRTQA